VPRFEPTDKVHVRLSQLSQAGHKIAADADVESLRRVESEVDEMASSLWGLTLEELYEMTACHRELTKKDIRKPGEEEQVPGEEAAEDE
jgi:hypothetical protein